jgi:hypothetical protein
VVLSSELLQINAHPDEAGEPVPSFLTLKHKFLRVGQSSLKENWCLSRGTSTNALEPEMQKCDLSTIMMEII